MGTSEMASGPIFVPETSLPIVVLSTAAQVANVDVGGASTGANDSLRVDLRQRELRSGAPTLPVPALQAQHVGLFHFALALCAACAGLVAGRRRL